MNELKMLIIFKLGLFTVGPTRYKDFTEPGVNLQKNDMKMKL